MSVRYSEISLEEVMGFTNHYSSEGYYDFSNVGGLEKLNDIYNSHSTSVEQFMIAASEELGISNNYSVAVMTNLKSVENVVETVRLRNQALAKRLKQGLESKSNVKFIDPWMFATEGKVGAFFEKMMKAIAAAFRRLVMAVGNLIKSISNWIRGKAASNQAKYYNDKKDSVKDWSEFVKDKEVKTLNYKKGLNDIISKIDNIATTVEKESNGSKNTRKVMDGIIEAADKAERVKGVSKNTTFVNSIKPHLKEIKNDIEDIRASYGRARATFVGSDSNLTSGDKIVKMFLTGATNPVVSKQKMEDVIKSITGEKASDKAFECLSAKDTAKLSSTIASCRKLLAGLVKDVVHIDKVTKKMVANLKKFDKHQEDSSVREMLSVFQELRKLTIESAVDARNFKALGTSILLSFFSNYLTQRAVIFSIFKKNVKENGGGKKKKDK